MASFHLQPDQNPGYEAYIEGRVLELGIKAGRRELEKKWEALRRGWYLGEEGFLARLKHWLARAARGRERHSHSGPARSAHDEYEAARLLQLGMKELGLPNADLLKLRKNATQKVALAWWLSPGGYAGRRPCP